MWGCRPHWLTLPKEIRSRIWRAYRVGQEVTKTPSAEYVAAAREAQEWIALRLLAACPCAHCHALRIEGSDLAPVDRLLAGSVMHLCEHCGNKRCPHATNHHHRCTGSNEPGQLGSAYGIADPLGR